MRLAFDLDNTLIRNNYAFPLERPCYRSFAELVQAGFAGYKEIRYQL